MMRAMIFAAGLGTRLRPLTDSMPKALIRVGGQPLLRIVARRLIDAGADTLVINAHHFAQQIIDYVSQEHGFGVHTDISLESERPLETGGGIRHAQSYLRGGSGAFLVHNVDILSDLDIQVFVKWSDARLAPVTQSLTDLKASFGALATLVVSERESSRYLLFDRVTMRLVGWTNVKTGEVKSPYRDLDLGQCRPLAFSGIHYISERIFDLMDSMQLPEAFSIIDFYLSIAAQYPIYGYVPDGGLRLIDVGKLDSLARAEEFLRPGAEHTSGAF